jgi:hypothetical protein
MSEGWRETRATKYLRQCQNGNECIRKNKRELTMKTQKFVAQKFQMIIALCFVMTILHFPLWAQKQARRRSAIAVLRHRQLNNEQVLQ